MQRRFFNLVVDSCRSGGSCVLRRINCASLFHPEKQHGSGDRTKQQQQLMMVEVAELPEPALSFDCCRNFMLMPLGCNMDNILSAHEDGSIVAYDARLNKVYGIPKIEGNMQNSLPIGVGDSLYLIKKCPDKSTKIFEGCSFRALINGKAPPTISPYERPAGWQWHPLPPPPYVEDPTYKRYSTSRIISYTVIDNKIWISAKGIGTYSFNTARRHWSKAGSWELPFRGSAKYVPELDHWFGFSSEERRRFLCASDLRTAANNNNSAAPTLCRVWEEELATIPEDWLPLASHLVHVGSGRFCIARFFLITDDDADADIKENFAIFTCVEVTKARDGELQMAVPCGTTLTTSCSSGYFRWSIWFERVYSSNISSRMYTTAAV